MRARKEQTEERTRYLRMSINVYNTHFVCPAPGWLFVLSISLSGELFEICHILREDGFSLPLLSIALNLSSFPQRRANLLNIILYIPINTYTSSTGLLGVYVLIAHTQPVTDSRLPQHFNKLFLLFLQLVFLLSPLLLCSVSEYVYRWVLRPVGTSTHTFKLVWLYPHYTLDFVTELIQSTYWDGSKVNRHNDRCGLYWVFVLQM